LTPRNRLYKERDLKIRTNFQQLAEVDVDHTISVRVSPFKLALQQSDISTHAEELREVDGVAALCHLGKEQLGRLEANGESTLSQSSVNFTGIQSTIAILPKVKWKLSDLQSTQDK